MASFFISFSGVLVPLFSDSKRDPMRSTSERKKEANSTIWEEDALQKQKPKLS